jgi:putative redox protein
MKQSVLMSWVSDMAFETSLNGHKIVIDASDEHGGNDLGSRPKSLMLVSLGGCTGMDVVSILKKMRVNFEKLEVVVEGDTSDEHPKKFLNMKVIYNFEGKDLPLDKIQKAVEMSRDKYCGVYATYKEAMNIEHVINIRET